MNRASRVGARHELMRVPQPQDLEVLYTIVMPGLRCGNRTIPFQLRKNKDHQAISDLRLRFRRTWWN